jgi:hypothetical protein
MSSSALQMTGIAEPCPLMRNRTILMSGIAALMSENAPFATFDVRFCADQ